MELTEITNNLDRIEQTFNFSVLEAKDYRSFFIMVNKLNTSLDISDAKVRNLATVMKEFSEAVIEMSGSLEQIIENRYPGILITTGLYFLSVIKDLSKIDLAEYQNCISYLKDLFIACFASIERNPNLTEVELNIVKAIMYTSLNTLKLYMYAVGDVDTSLQGVEIKFEKRRKS